MCVSVAVPIRIRMNFCKMLSNSHKNMLDHAHSVHFQIALEKKTTEDMEKDQKPESE